VASSAPLAAIATGILVAVVAGLPGLGGAVFNAHREHDRWLQEARIKAYAHVLGCATTVTSVGVEAGSGNGSVPI
jgi:hypothetical protein